MTLFLIVMLFLISIIDTRKRIIPNRALAVLLMTQLTIYFFADSPAIKIAEEVLTGFCCSFVFLTAYIISKKSIGAGDVKLFFVIGFCSDPEDATAVLVISSLCALLFSLVLLLLKKVRLNDTLPFAPFALAGVIGNEAVNIFS